MIRQIATLASCSFDDIVDNAAPGQEFFVQLYVNRDREITRKYVQHAEKRGVKGLFITVDAPQLGRREKDMRMKQVDESASAEVQKGHEVKKDQGVARAISVSAHFYLPSISSITYSCAAFQSFIDPSLSWKDIPWFKSITKSTSGLLSPYLAK